jgi:hypothetical protein
MTLSSREVQALFRHTAEAQARALVTCELVRLARQDRALEREQRAAIRRANLWDCGAADDRFRVRLRPSRSA